MRLRGRKDVREWLQEQTDLVVLDPKPHRGKWQSFFGNGKPIYVELGMGKGNFITEMSLRHPGINFIGVDLYDVLIGRAADLYYSMLEEVGNKPSNLALLRMNIEALEEAFAENEIERIYLNFSDPWPKTRHAGRRLTHPRFLQKYLRLLNENGEIHFKTDSTLLFEFSLNAFADMELCLRNISLDLHKDGQPEWNVMTEYESKFVARGMNIYRCELVIGEKSLAEHRKQKKRALFEQ